MPALALLWHGTHDGLGQTFMTWDSPLYTTFFRWQHYEDWIVTTQATHLWQHYNDFCTLIFNACAHVVVSHPGP